MSPATLAASAARALERGTWQSRVATTLSRAWCRSARPVRRVALPPGVRVIGVGGSTLGGSYKTPLVLALARALAESGERVVVVGHGHRGRSVAPRRVAPQDSAREVGDEALWLARDLESWGVPVVSGGTGRDAALRIASALAPTVLMDALLQARPERLALSVLSLDAEAPWGAARCPPAGDLRASRARLLAAADVVAAIEDERRPSTGRPRLDGGGVRTRDAESPADQAPLLISVGSRLASARRLNGDEVPLEQLCGARIGLLLAIARPERVLRALAARGLPVVERLFLPDHSDPSAIISASRAQVDAWLTTPKCAAKLDASKPRSAPVLVLRHELVLPRRLVELAAGGA